MPTDEVDLEETPPEAESTEAEGTPEQPAARPAAGGPSGEDIAQIMREAAETGNQPVLEALQQLQQIMAHQAQRDAPQRDYDQERNQLADRLLTDPESVLGESMTNWGRTQLAPMMSRAMEVDRDERIEARAMEVDDRFGDGYFDEHIRPRLVGERGNLSAYPINQQADPLVIDSAIRGILGNMLMDPEQGPKIEEAMAKAAKARHERDVMAPPNMMGPGRSPRGRGNVLTPEMKEALGKFQDVGVKVTEQDVKNALTRGRTLSDWLPKEAPQ